MRLVAQEGPVLRLITKEFGPPKRWPLPARKKGLACGCVSGGIQLGNVSESKVTAALLEFRAIALESMATFGTFSRFTMPNLEPFSLLLRSNRDSRYSLSSVQTVVSFTARHYGVYKLKESWFLSRPKFVGLCLVE